MSVVDAGLFDLHGRVAIVTGGGKGIGARIALVLASAGAYVVVSGRNRESLDAVAGQIKALGGRALAVPADIQEVADVQALVDGTVREFGTVDILVNNAGVNRTGPTLEVTEQTWDAIFDTNVKGAFFGCQAAGRHMIDRRQGKIINIASIAAVIGVGYNIPYTASKGAMWQLTRSLALEWARHNIQVNAIGPGYVLTDQVRWLFEQPEFAQKILQKQPTGRIANLSDLDGAVIFLASAASNYVNGQMLIVDGASASGWMGPE